jgi:hypothetical protein
MSNHEHDHDKANGYCIAYRCRPYPPEFCRVKYELNFEPVDFVQEFNPGSDNHDAMGEEVVILVSPTAARNIVLDALAQMSEIIAEDGLYVGDWHTYDPNHTYRLYDQGDRISGKPED